MLTDPGAWGTRALDTLAARLAVYGPVWGSAGAATALAAAVLAAALRRVRRAAWAHRARWVEIIPAPQVDPDGAAALWATLYGLRRNRWVRLWRGQEHLGFEILADADGPRFGFWVPATLTEGFVANQVRAAWPGTQVRVHTTPPALIPHTHGAHGPGAGTPGVSTVRVGSARGGPVVCVVGRLRLGASPALGLKTEHRIDPLRMVLAALGELHPGQSACVQVLARPLASRARLRRAAARLLDARPTGIRLPVWMLTELARGMAQETLNLFHPATAHTTGHHHYHGGHSGGHTGSRDHDRGGRAGRAARRADVSAAVRARTTGAAQLWTVQVRYAAAYLPHPHENADEETQAAGRVETRREWARREWARREWARREWAQVWCRGRAGQIGASMAVFTAHNHLRRRLTPATTPDPDPDPGAGADPGADPGAGAGAGAVSPMRRVLMRVWRRWARARAGWAQRAMLRRWMSRRWCGLGGGQSWTGAELAALAHLPTDPRVPGLARAGAHQIPPPRQVPTGGPEAKILGDATTGRARAVAVPVSDCCCHIHIPGATGNGKTTLIAQLCLADITRRLALILIDGKGDLGRDLHRRIPAEHLTRVVLFDPDSPGKPPTLALLDPADPLTVDHLAKVCAQVWAPWGHRMDTALRAGCHTELAHYRHRASIDPTTRIPTLADVLALFTDDAHRTRVTAPLAHTAPGSRARELHHYWTDYHTRPPGGRDELAGTLVNRLRGLLTGGHQFVRDVLLGDGPPINLPHILAHGGIALARLPEGVLGADATRLLGSLLVTKTWQATTARATQPEHHRPPASLYLDECHLFLNLPDTLDTVLSQARAYRLGLVLAHQHLAQLGPELARAVSANALNKIIFRQDPTDARQLATHTTPELTDYDLAHLDRYTAAARLLIDGNETPAFTLTTRPLPPPPAPQRSAA